MSKREGEVGKNARKSHSSSLLPFFFPSHRESTDECRRQESATTTTRCRNETTEHPRGYIVHGFPTAVRHPETFRGPPKDRDVKALDLLSRETYPKEMGESRTVSTMGVLDKIIPRQRNHRWLNRDPNTHQKNRKTLHNVLPYIEFSLCTKRKLVINSDRILVTCSNGNLWILHSFSKGTIKEGKGKDPVGVWPVVSVWKDPREWTVLRNRCHPGTTSRKKQKSWRSTYGGLFLTR